MQVSHFVRPNGELYRIINIVTDDSSVLIELENGFSRWFRYNEILVVPPFIKMVVVPLFVADTPQQ